MAAPLVGGKNDTRDVSYQPLEPASTSKVLGFDMTMDDEEWEWMIVFPLPTDEKSKTKYGEKMDDPIGAAKQIFKPIVWTQWKDSFDPPITIENRFKKDMTKKDFSNTVREVLMQILSSKKCGLIMKTQMTIDKDEALLLLRSPPKDDAVNDMDMSVQQRSLLPQLADRYELRVQLNASAYPELGGKSSCPTCQLERGEFKTDAEACPMYMRYQAEFADKFQEFNEVVQMRLIKRRLNEFMHTSKLMELEVALMCTPVHHWKSITAMRKEGLSDPYKPWRFPRAQDEEMLREYFGEEVAFFFAWLYYYTRWMAVAGVLGFLCFFRRFAGLDLDTQRYIQMGFAVFMVLWAAYFNAYWLQRSSFLSVKWGMKNYDQVATVRKEFLKDKRGSLKEALQMNAHWVLAAIFMAETLFAVFGINAFRVGAADAARHGEETYFGVAPKTAVSLGKYLITANIKLVDIVWKHLSPTLSKYENWKTEQAYKAAMINKLFAVKALVYYYPFFYIAFIQQYVDGCEPKGSKTACVDMLAENLEIFFAVHIATVLGTLLATNAMTWMKVRWEINKVQKDKSTPVLYKYLEFQTKLAEYPGDTDDFMELVLGFGFILMFSVVLPVMATAAFIVAMLEKQFLAYGMTMVYQRTYPTGQEGIGAWAGIIRIVSTIGIICNVAMACFQMYPMKEQPMHIKMLVFIAAEHVLLSVNGMIQGSIPPEDVLTVCITERQDEMSDEVISGEEAKPVFVKPTEKPSGCWKID